MYYSHYNDNGTGYAYEGKEGAVVIKSGLEAKDFWLTNNSLIVSKSCIFHVRKATNGCVSDANAHPHTCGRVAVVHNGVISGYGNIKTELEGKGHKFTSETDSEVFAHAYGEYGLQFIEKMAKSGVTGTATVLVLDGDKIILYTNSNTIHVYKLGSGLVGFSDSSFFSNDDEVPIRDDVIYVISRGRIVKTMAVRTGIGSGFDRNGWYDEGLCRRQSSTWIEKAISNAFAVPYANVLVTSNHKYIKIEIDSSAEDLRRVISKLGGALTSQGLVIYGKKKAIKKRAFKAGLTEVGKAIAASMREHKRYAYSTDYCDYAWIV
ncbi:MAG: hypothetical protein DRI44_05380 [Chlamydiae bacterium]|nr:MAG: hypothetical protein DRI44_05380 [Chlamydiota bacterium]